MPYVAGGGAVPGLFDFKQAGTSPLELWYPQSPAASLTNVTPNLNQLQAVPFIGRTGTLDRISIEVTTLAAGGVARAGIYRATSQTNIYPSSLIVDGGEVSSASNGVKTQTISAAISAGVLYWFAFNTGTLAANFRGAASTSLLSSILGVLPTMGATSVQSLTVALAYGALPASFPAGAAAVTTPSPIIAVRYAT